LQKAPIEPIIPKRWASIDYPNEKYTDVMKSPYPEEKIIMTISLYVFGFLNA